MTDATEPSLERVEDDLERATELAAEEAIDRLREAHRELQALRSADVDEERRQALETRVEQRLSEVGERDRYDSEMGAAMNPDDDAP
ncbi:hypothetical protein [Natronobeatus ordinarius]|uniref:hypothetical protein n=1 Tax=Natronobeatus ordinarius TaxID=2963433 RepID=UPI0020CF41AA|nr:hypothetical protein [Natronobeatus ordinarius]